MFKLHARLDLILPLRKRGQVSPSAGPEGSNNVKSVRSFLIGEIVWVKCFQNRKPFWTTGTIIKKNGCRLYTVRLDKCNTYCKRHIDQLLRYTNNVTIKKPVISKQFNPDDDKIVTENDSVIVESAPSSPPDQAESGDPSLVSIPHEEEVDEWQEASQERIRVGPQTQDVGIEHAGSDTAVPGRGEESVDKERLTSHGMMLRPRNKNIKYK